MSKKISIIFLLVAIVLVFHKYFLPSTLVFGDAPFFYKDGLKELLFSPSAWSTRGNTFGNINLFLWIYPLMVIYGLLGTVLHLGNDLILKVLFYFPSLIFGALGIYLTVKHLKASNLVRFFAVLVYLVNTYYLLLIDGGQVGVVLAYGLFPLCFYLLLKIIDKFNTLNFILSVVGLFILTVVDFRVSFLCFFTVFLFKLIDRKKILNLLPVVIFVIGLSSYWLLPTLKLASSGLATDIATLQTTSLLNSLLISSPNWPYNEFGKVIQPYFYFTLIPVLIFLPLLISKKKEVVWLTLCFLICTFLAKGESNPGGVLYHFILQTHLGSVFRDSTKFFIPLILFASILIGTSVEEIVTKIENKNYKIVFKSFIFVFLLFLVWQGILGKLNGVLGGNRNISDFEKIANVISKEKGFLRSAWFDAKSPFAYSTNEKQAIDAQDLVNFRPFLSMNVGSGDRFNFINNSLYLDWFNLLGIKYLILNGNPRVQNLSKSDQEDWQRLTGLMVNDARLENENITSSVPVYKNENVHPNKFFVNKTYLIVGGDDIYEKLKKSNPNFSVGNQGFLFAEDGKLDLNNLQDIASTSADIIYNNKNEDDLRMAFLQSNFVSPNNAVNSEWAIRSSEDMLQWKFELLVNKIDFHEFDYGKGIAFSSQPKEKITFNLDAPDDDQYYLDIRSMDASNSGDLKVNFNAKDYNITRTKNNNFEWFEVGPISLQHGKYLLSIQNSTGFQVVNTVALIKAADIARAKQLTQNFVGTFDHFDIQNNKDNERLTNIIGSNKWQSWPNNVNTGGWLIYTDTYNPNWEITNKSIKTMSVPAYSMINEFYIKDTSAKNTLLFEGDMFMNFGIYFSLVTLLVFILLVLWLVLR